LTKEEKKCWDYKSWKYFFTVEIHQKNRDDKKKKTLWISFSTSWASL